MCPKLHNVWFTNYVVPGLLMAPLCLCLCKIVQLKMCMTNLSFKFDLANLQFCCLIKLCFMNVGVLSILIALKKLTIFSQIFDGAGGDKSFNPHWSPSGIMLDGGTFDSIQILTAQEDDGGNYHSRGAIHTRPTIIPEAKPRIAQYVVYPQYVDSTKGVIISTIIRLWSSQYLFYIPHT